MLTRRLALAVALLSIALAGPLAAADPAKAPSQDIHGDPLPVGAVARLGTVRWRHHSPIALVRYFDDGRRVASVSLDGTVCTWDATTGRELRRIEGNSENLFAAMCLSLADHGTTLVLADRAGMVRRLDLETGKEVGKFAIKPAAEPFREQRHSRSNFTSPVAAANGWALSADGRSLYIKGFDHVIRELDATTGKERRHFEAPRCPKAERDLKSTIKFADGFVEPGLNRRPDFWGGNFNHLAWSNDRKHLISLDPEIDKLRFYEGRGMSWEPGGMITFFDAKSGKALRQFRIPFAPFRALAHSRDGTALALTFGERINDSTTLEIRDAITGKQLRILTYLPFGNQVTGLIFSPDDKTLAVRTDTGALFLVDVATGRTRVLLGIQAIRSGWNDTVEGFTDQKLVFSPDGKILAVAARHMLRFWDVATGSEIDAEKGFGGPVHSIVVQPDAKTIVTHAADGSIQEWHRGTARARGQFCLPVDAYEVSLSANGRAVAFRMSFEPHWTLQLFMDLLAPERPGRNNSLDNIFLWSTSGGRSLWYSPETVKPGLFAFTSDSATLAYRYQFEPEVIRRWELATGKELPLLAEPGQPLEGYASTGGVGPCLGLSTDGNHMVTALVAGAKFDRESHKQEGGLVRVWDLAAGRCVFQFDTGEKVGLSALIFSPDGHTLATVNGRGHASLWELASGRRRANLEGVSDQEAVIGADGKLLPQGSRPAFSPDGRLLAAGGWNGLVRLWDAHTGKELAILRGHRGSVNSVVFSPDGKELISGGDDCTALIWDMTPYRQPGPPVQLRPREAENLWLALGSNQAGEAFQAIAQLSAGPRQAVPLLKQHLQPEPGIEPQQIDRWIAALDGGEFTEREQASAALQRAGWAAAPALTRALAEKPSLEVRRRVEAIQKELGKRMPTGEELRPLRALEVLERIATPEARQVLAKLAGGAAQADLTRRARAALARLETSK